MRLLLCRLSYLHEQHTSSCNILTELTTRQLLTLNTQTCRLSACSCRKCAEETQNWRVQNSLSDSDYAESQPRHKCWPAGRAQVPACQGPIHLGTAPRTVGRGDFQCKGAASSAGRSARQIRPGIGQFRLIAERLKACKKQYKIPVDVSGGKFSSSSSDAELSSSQGAASSGPSDE